MVLSMRFHIGLIMALYYKTLLHCVTDIITKCDSYFITKRYRSLLQNASGFLLQNATVITKCDVYLKL